MRRGSSYQNLCEKSPEPMHFEALETCKTLGLNFTLSHEKCHGGEFSIQP